MPQPRTLSPSHPRPYPTPLVCFLRVTTHPLSRLSIHMLSEGTRPVALFWGSHRPLLYCSLAPLLQPHLPIRPNSRGDLTCRPGHAAHLLDTLPPMPPTPIPHPKEKTQILSAPSP